MTRIESSAVIEKHEHDGKHREILGRKKSIFIGMRIGSQAWRFTEDSEGSEGSEGRDNSRGSGSLTCK